MPHTADRRSVLKVCGAATAVGLAGCPGNSTDTATSTEDSELSNPDSSSEEEPAGGVGFVEDTPSDLLYEATSIEGDLVYVEGASEEFEQVRAVFDGETGPYFSGAGNFRLGDDGLIYKAVDRNGSESESIIMDGGDELVRRDEPVSVEDFADGEPVWRVDGEPSVFYHGEERIETEYEALRAVKYVGDSFAFIGRVQIDQGQFQEEVVHGDDVIDEGGVFMNLTDLDGTPMYSGAKGNGEFVSIGDTTVGEEYTRLSGGSIEQVESLEGRPMFVATVHPDEQEHPDMNEEKALWFDGEEIGRYDQVLDTAVIGDRFAYLYVSPDATGITLTYGGDELGSEYKNVTRLGDIDGTLAYQVELPDERVDGENDAAIVYQGAESDAYRSIQNVFELDGSAAFVAQTGTGPASNILLRGQA